MSLTNDGPTTRGETGAHQVYRWAGSAYDIGLQHGQALRDEIAQEVAPALAESARRNGCTTERVAAAARAAWAPLFEKHTPQVMEEIRGLAEGSELDEATAFFAALHCGTHTPLPGNGECTALVCSGTACAEGHVVIGQTKDTTAPLTRYRIMELQYDDGHTSVLLNYPGWVANIGITSRGISFTGNSLYARPPDRATTPTSFLRRLLLERETIDEVLGCIEGLIFDNGCTLMADRTGHAVCLEAAAGEVAIMDVSDTVFAHANSIRADTLHIHEDAELFSPSSPGRQARLQQLLDDHAGSMTAPLAQRFLSDHTGFPLSVCRHKCADDPLWTTGAFVADLTVGRIHIAIGHPCTAGFREYRLPEPPGLAPGTQRD